LTDKEPERYYDWMLWKMRQLDKEEKTPKIYESPDGGKTIYERNFMAPHETRKLVEREKGYPSYEAVNSINYKYDEDKLIEEFKKYVDSTYSAHYSKEKFQATEFIMDGGHGTGFCIGNVLKYAQRYGKKGTHADARKDLMKVLHYALMQLYIHDSEDKK
tara:strand:- start:1212 stop:1691 length:480 start_codon:yes stop_codon:yes gene_type:complete